MDPIFILIFGLLLIIVGLMVAGGGEKDTTKLAENRAFMLFGSITQRIENVRLVIKGEREKSSRDLIGWSMSGVGVIVGLIGIYLSL